MTGIFGRGAVACDGDRVFADVDRDFVARVVVVREVRLVRAPGLGVVDVVAAAGVSSSVAALRSGVGAVRRRPLPPRLPLCVLAFVGSADFPFVVGAGGSTAVAFVFAAVGVFVVAERLRPRPPRLPRRVGRLLVSCSGLTSASRAGVDAGDAAFAAGFPVPVWREELRRGRRDRVVAAGICSNCTGRARSNAMSDD